MIHVYLNNEPYTVPSKQTLHAFLRVHNHTEQHFAIAINQQFIPRALYGTTVLYENDRIDIIVPMQGG